jgi:flavin-dependent dehydrogenase
VAIAGGGPAASAAAIALRRHGLSCAIVERGDGGGDKVGESLAPSVKPLLAALGLDLERDGHLPCHGHRSVWGSDTPVEMPFDLSPYGHGWHLDRRKFEERLAELAGVPRFTNTRVIDVEREQGGWRVTCHSERSEESPSAGDPSPRLGMTLLADFLIDATGRRAAIARRLGARIVRDDTLVAHVFFLERAQGAGGGAQWEPNTKTTICALTPAPRALIDETYTYIEAAEHGWWYRAPVPDGRVVAMFVSDRRTHNAKTLDASSFRLDRVTGPRWLAVGDAATALDPLSSHGLGNALFTGMRAAEAIVSGDFAAYENAVDVMWNAYVSRRRELYASERRWPSSPFWSRRYTSPP